MLAGLAAQLVMGLKSQVNHERGGRCWVSDTVAWLAAYLVLAGLAAQLVMGLMSQVSHGGCLEGDTVAERALAGLATQPGVRFMAQVSHCGVAMHSTQADAGI